MKDIFSQLIMTYDIYDIRSLYSSLRLVNIKFSKKALVEKKKTKKQNKT